MKIAGFQKMTMVDYPGKIACILFTQGCNFSCPWCHNSELIKHNNENLINEEEIFDYLEKRRNIIDAIVISGGEPTLQKDLIEFLEKIKKYNLLIKLDTNGSNPSVLEKIMDKKLIDYIAMDIKNVFIKYENTIGCKTNLNNIKKSISLIKNSDIDYEFRTTVIKEFHDQKDIEKIFEYIGEKNYYIQNFKDNENVIYKGFGSFEEKELKKINDKFPKLIIRGLEFTKDKGGM